MTTNQPTSSAGNNAGMRSEIQVKWSKFSSREIAALKNKDDLVTQVVAKYGLEKSVAQRDVDALMKGRHI